jgi:hypothetical protein
MPKISNIMANPLQIVNHLRSIITKIVLIVVKAIALNITTIIRSVRKRHHLDYPIPSPHKKTR